MNPIPCGYDNSCSNDEMVDGLYPEAMEDYFRIEARQWLMENGERLFIDKLRMIIEPERKIVKPKIKTNKDQ